MRLPLVLLSMLLGQYALGAKADKPIILDFPPDIQKKFEKKNGKLASDGTLIPKWEVTIQKPGKDIPQKCRNFLGIWSGQWIDEWGARRIPHRVTVYRIDLVGGVCSASVFISRGADPEREDDQIPFFSNRTELKIESGTLHQRVPAGPIEYVHETKGGQRVLRVTFYNHEIPSWAILKRIDETSNRKALAPIFANVPLPDDVKIVSPGPTIPSQNARYSGRWSGTWSNGLNHVLVVERIGLRGVTVIYAWGKRRGRPGRWRRKTASFVSGKLKVILGKGRYTTYKFSGSGSLEAVFKGNRTLHANLTKAQ